MRIELLIGYAGTEFIDRWSHLKHLHHFIAEVVDDFHGNAAGLGPIESS